MKTDVLEPQLIVATQHLRLPVRPQSKRRMSASNRMLPKMRKCLGGLQEIAYKVWHRLILLVPVETNRAGRPENSQNLRRYSTAMPTPAILFHDPDCGSFIQTAGG